MQRHEQHQKEALKLFLREMRNLGSEAYSLLTHDSPKEISKEKPTDLPHDQPRTG
jgi:dsDNA-binding SOS-regulon protein